MVLSRWSKRSRRLSPGGPASPGDVLGAPRTSALGAQSSPHVGAGAGPAQADLRAICRGMSQPPVSVRPGGGRGVGTT